MALIVNYLLSCWVPRLLQFEGLYFLPYEFVLLPNIIKSDVNLLFTSFLSIVIIKDIKHLGLRDLFFFSFYEDGVESKEGNP